MEIWNRQSIHRTAGERLDRASYAPRKLVLLHTGAALVLSALVTMLNFFITRQIDTTGGLSGMGSRAVLQTARTMFQLAGVVLLPFWELGFLFSAIKIARGKSCGPHSLLEGFRRFFPALRLMLLRIVVYFAIGLVCINVGSVIFSLTPWSKNVLDLLEPIILTEDPQQMELLMEQLSMDTLLQAMLPAWILFGAIYALLVIPVLYRFRMAELVLMDAPKTGAFTALRTSNQIMRRHCIRLFRLDLDFWWFYVLRLLIVALSYGDVLLEMLGVSLPIGEDMRFFVFYFAYALCQLALYMFAYARVKTTYAVAYDVLLEKSQGIRKREIPIADAGYYGQ